MTDQTLLYFTVHGIPAPQGSKKAVGRTNTGRVLLAESSNKVKPWRDLVRAAALNARPEGFQIIDEPVYLQALFFLSAPKTIPKKRGGFPATYPDLDKLLRSTCDALANTKTAPGVLADDSLIIRISAVKVYVGDTRHVDTLDQPGAQITIHSLKGL